MIDISMGTSMGMRMLTMMMIPTLVHSLVLD